MFSLFPSLATLFALWGIALDPGAVERQVRPLENLLPKDVFDIIYNQMLSLDQTESEYLSLAGFWASCWHSGQPAPAFPP